MALYSVVFLGSTPIGGPLAGWLSEAYDPRVALLLAGVAGLSAAWAAHVCFTRLRDSDAGARPARTERTRGLASGEPPPLVRPPSRCSRLPSRYRRATSFGGLFFEFDPGVELLHHLQRQAFLDLRGSSFRSPGPASSATFLVVTKMTLPAGKTSLSSSRITNLSLSADSCGSVVKRIERSAWPFSSTV